MLSWCKWLLVCNAVLGGGGGGGGGGEDLGHYNEKWRKYIM